MYIVEYTIEYYSHTEHRYGGGNEEFHCTSDERVQHSELLVETDKVNCKCGDALKHYEMSLEGCLSSCPSGTYWHSNESVHSLQIESEVRDMYTVNEVFTVSMTMVPACSFQLYA